MTFVAIGALRVKRTYKSLQSNLPTGCVLIIKWLVDVEITSVTFGVI